MFGTGGSGQIPWMRREGNGLAWVVRELTGRGKGEKAETRPGPLTKKTFAVGTENAEMRV